MSMAVATEARSSQPVPTISSLKIQDRVLILSVTIGKYGDSKKLDSKHYDTHDPTNQDQAISKSLVTANAKLIECDELDAIKKHQGKVKTWLTETTMNSPFKR